MFRSATLSSDHFASKWVIPSKEDFHGYEDTNALGITYANLPDGSQKENLMLELTQCFHGYIMKYLNMIVKGHLPAINSSSGIEAIKFLRLLASNQKDTSSKMYGEVCRTLHLAFKQSTTDEVYDSLQLCLLRAIAKYDPNYIIKLKKVCDLIDIRCKGKRRREGTTPEFTSQEITEEMKADTNSYLRKLVKRGHLKSITDKKRKVIGYRRNPETWPPPPVLFKSGPVGFTYAVQTYFRFYLHEFITNQMHCIEAKEGMLQLDHRSVGDSNWESIGDPGLPHSNGNFTDSDGKSWAADVSLMNRSLDISIMNEEWVQHTEDKLFKRLDKSERNLLYLTYVKEFNITEIATILGIESKSVRAKREEIMTYLRGHSK